jgi:hypothetical protein
MRRNGTASPPCFRRADLPRPPASCCRYSAGRPRPQPMAGGRKNGRPAAAMCSWCRATARWAIACRWVRCRMCPSPTILSSIPPIRPNRAAICPIRPRKRWPDRRRPKPRARRLLISRLPRPRNSASNRKWASSAGQCARRFPSSRATVACACSCRRLRRWRITSILSRRLKRLLTTWASRFISKATARRMIRAST